MRTYKRLFFISLSLALHILLGYILLYHNFSSTGSEPLSFSIVPQTRSGPVHAPAKTAAASPRRKVLTGARATSKNQPAAANLEQDKGKLFSQLNSTSGSAALKIDISYPPMSLRAREEGQAHYQLMFGANNQLQAYKLLRSTGYSRLDEAVAGALAKSMSPADGSELRAELLIIDFRLEDRGGQIRFSSKSI